MDILNNITIQDLWNGYNFIRGYIPTETIFSKMDSILYLTQQTTKITSVIILSILQLLFKICLSFVCFIIQLLWKLVDLLPLFVVFLQNFIIGTRYLFQQTIFIISERWQKILIAEKLINNNETEQDAILSKDFTKNVNKYSKKNLTILENWYGGDTKIAFSQDVLQKLCIQTSLSRKQVMQWIYKRRYVSKKCC